MAEAVLEGIKISCRQTGSGENVVLVHGLGANQAFWNMSLVTGLARDFLVTTFDLRGHGYSAMPPSSYRPIDLAADLHALLDYLEIDQAHLVGHSFGGRVALQFALDQPERVLSLTIADTRLHCLQPGQMVTASRDWPQLRTTLAEHGVILDEDDSDLGFSVLGALASLPENTTSRRSTEDVPYLPFGKRGARSARRWMQLLAETSIDADHRDDGDLSVVQLSTLPAPVLAVYGDASPTRLTGERIGASLPNCQTVFVRGGKHFHPATHPQFFQNTVRTFLSQVARQRGRTSVIPPRHVSQVACGELCSGQEPINEYLSGAHTDLDSVG